MEDERLEDNRQSEPAAAVHTSARLSFRIRDIVDTTTLAAITCCAIAYLGANGMRGLLGGAASTIFVICCIYARSLSDFTRVSLCVGGGAIGGAIACPDLRQLCAGVVAGSLVGGSIAAFWYRIAIPRLTRGCPVVYRDRSAGRALRGRHTALQIGIVLLLGPFGGLLAAGAGFLGGDVLEQDKVHVLSACLAVGTIASVLVAIPLVVALLLADKGD